MSQQIGLLLVPDMYFSLVQPRLLRLVDNLLVLQNTHLDWVLGSFVDYSLILYFAIFSTSQNGSLFIGLYHNDDLLERFRSLDDVSQTKILPDVDHAAETIFRDNKKYLRIVDVPSKSSSAYHKLGEPFH